MTFKKSFIIHAEYLYSYEESYMHKSSQYLLLETQNVQKEMVDKQYIYSLAREVTIRNHASGEQLIAENMADI